MGYWYNDFGSNFNISPRQRIERFSDRAFPQAFNWDYTSRNFTARNSLRHLRDRRVRR
jgi:hypothetical protein